MTDRTTTPAVADQPGTAFADVAGPPSIPKAALLNGTGTGWVVERGYVDIFAVAAHPGEVYGPLFPLGRLGPGDAIAGLAVATADGMPDILAIPGRGATLRPMSAAATATATNAEAEQAGCDPLDGWIANLIAWSAPGAAPRGTLPVVPGRAIRLSPDMTLGTVLPLIWLMSDQPLTVAGHAEFPARTILPLTRDLWVQSGVEATCRTQTSAGLPDDATRAAARAGATIIALEGIARRLAQGRADTAAAVAASDQAATRRVRMAAAGLAGTIESALRRPGAKPGGDPLFAACTRVAAAEGLTLGDWPAPAPGTGDLSDRTGAVEAIARANRMRARRARLDAEWWRADYGPFVAFTAAGEPVAMIPARLGYHAFMADGTRQKVDAALAGDLDGDVFAFYRGFADGELKGQQIFSFAFTRNFGTLMTILLASFAASILGLLTPIVSGRIVDTIIPHADYDQLLQVTIVLVAAAFAALGFHLSQSLSQLRLRGRLDAAVQAAVWDRLLRLPSTFFHAYDVGDLANRAAGINTLSRALTGATMSALFGGLFSFISFGLMVYYAPKLALVALVAIVLVIGFSAGFAWYDRLVQREQLELRGRLSARIFQFIRGIETIRVNGAERFAFGDWAERYARDVHFQLRSTMIGWGQGLVSTAIFSAFSVFSFAYFAFFADDVSTGTYIAFHAAFGQLSGGLSGFVGAIITVYSLAPIYERTEPILKSDAESDASRGQPGDLTGRIEVTDLCFAYEGSSRRVLDGVSMRVSPGEFIAIVGGSGSGKSTLLKILLGLVQPVSGRVTFDGRELSTMDPGAFRRQLGVVLQNGMLLPGTIYDNITMNAPFTLAEVQQAVRDAGLETDLDAMPMGLQTPVSEGAATFSGGQKQRLLIARALVRRPRILLLDEATSALDNVTQARVGEALSRMNATRIVIAHRLSTIVNADCIHVLKDGRFVESGTYQDLLEQGGAFAELARRQLVSD
ncbi:NHLP bacteriocin export ABC transporter permease/ATPase subunit [Chachezhania sediminis]|uniref:NHLP bacteriocin export ABC transporter permease/ATPase subunit n=1 Tax=Chachezhania sediminis TaxID=2599291 RepID=UPI00131EC037|nr:NHLP bacteriocin export ABC transporter permease/ATPase subunit [Chachezhania sediminis]